MEGTAPRSENDDPNTVFFWGKQNSRFEELARILEQRLADNTARGVDPTAVEFDSGESRLNEIQAKQQATQNGLVGQSAGGNEEAAGLTEEGSEGGFVVPGRMAKDRAEETRARTFAMEIDRRLNSIDSPSTVDSQPTTSDIPDLIRKLAELRDSNIISSEEFEAKKAELLSRM